MLDQTDLIAAAFERLPYDGMKEQHHGGVDNNMDVASDFCVPVIRL